MDCTALTVVEQPALPVELTATLELAADFAKASKAKATQDAYESDFRIFESWCRPRGLNPLPASAESLCAFLADQASLGKRASTLGRRLPAAILCASFATGRSFSSALPAPSAGANSWRSTSTTSRRPRRACW